MAVDISTIVSAVIADATQNNGLDAGDSLSSGSLARLYLCAEHFIGHAAEEVLWDRVREHAATEASETAAVKGQLIQLPGAVKGRANSELFLPVQLFVETYIQQLSDLVGRELCLRHIKACYEIDD